MKIFSLPALATCALLALALDAHATLIDFNTLADGDYGSGSYTSNGYIFTASSSILASTSDFQGSGPTDGSVYLASYTPYGYVTSFSFSATNADPFSLQSFDFDNGYPTYYRNNVGSLTVTGTLQNGSTTSQTFSNLGADSAFTELNLNASFADLSSVTFVATAAAGNSDPAGLFDNFTVTAASVPSAVPDSGATVAMLGGALLCLTALRRKFARA